MSSVAVRTAVLQFIADNAPTENVIDLTSQFEELKEMLDTAGISDDAPWLGVQFQGDDEVPVALAADNLKGKYRETGAIYFHVVTTAQIGNGTQLLTRGEALRNLLRGQRIGAILIESVTPMNFDAGATLQFEGGYMSGSFIVGYQMDIDL